MPSVLSKLPVMMSEEDIADPRYENTILYFLAHKDDVETKKNIYIGHTINKPSRICRHRIHATNPEAKEYKDRKYAYIRENGGWFEWRMIELETFNCKNRYEAEDREEYWKGIYPASLNTLKSGEIRRQGGHQQYKKKYNADWYKNNREHALAMKRRTAICDKCGKEINKHRLKRHQASSNCVSLQIT